MNLEGAGYDRCAKHPSQLFTGFCSSCLAERLSSVDCVVERNPNPNPSPNPQSEIVEIAADSEVRVRRTLLSLFQLDDGDGVESDANARSDLAKSASVGSSSRSSAKGLRWRIGSRRAQVEEGCFNCVIGGGGRSLDRKHSLRHSCEWKAGLGRDDGRDGLEKPRHSWDGSMMGKALTCSFAACLEDPQDGSSRIGRSVPEETSGSVNVSLPEDKPKSPREVLHEDSRREISVLDVNRKKTHRWSRVWDWSFTSPFRDFGKKRQHVLDRSMSESWPESRGMAEPDIGVHSSANGHGGSIRMSQGSKRSINGAGNELQKFRPDMQKKREYMFGRSRSVHYPSPRNVDNGLLRFYLTPMRTSRSTNKGRAKRPHFFTKSLLGL